LKAVLLAAGRGTRLGGITDEIPKPLLPVSGKPILQHAIELCCSHGVTELFINTHYLADRIKEHFGNGGPFGASIVYSYEPELLGTAGALQNFHEDLKDNDFFVLYGDNISNYDLSSMLSHHRSRQAIATVALFYKADVSLSGVAVLDESNRITDFREKPQPGERVSHMANAGIYVLSPRILQYIPNGFSDFGKDIFPRLVSSGELVAGWVADNAVGAADTPELYASLSKNSKDHTKASRTSSDSV
jgi:NDP-sugar pyrophosphorylase family protein